MSDPAGEVGQWKAGRRPVRPLAIRRIEPRPRSTEVVDVETPNRPSGGLALAAYGAKVR